VTARPHPASLSEPRLLRGQYLHPSAIPIALKIDPTSLRLFIAIVEEGSIAAAAEREHLAGAAVSKRITQLEYVLRTQLLSRTHKGVEPTAAGVALLNLARRAVSYLDDLHVQMPISRASTPGSRRCSPGGAVSISW
jgi:DNA-binding transcriptional LysR family regulator